jgi:excisionase family DNA binding protein
LACTPYQGGQAGCKPGTSKQGNNSTGSASVPNTQAVSQSQSIAPRLLNIRGAAAYLGCSIWAVRSLAWGGSVPNIKIGNRILFDKADLDAFVDRNKSRNPN